VPLYPFYSTRCHNSRAFTPRSKTPSPPEPIAWWSSSKKNIKLDTAAKASVADSKKVVALCTQYAQKGLFNIFLVVFFTTLSFAFLEPFFFVGYLGFDRSARPLPGAAMTTTLFAIFFGVHVARLRPISRSL
jgi:hypothetical protein